MCAMTVYRRKRSLTRLPFTSVALAQFHLAVSHQRKQSADPTASTCHCNSQRYRSLKQLIRLVRDSRRQDIIPSVLQHCSQIEQFPNLDLNDANGFGYLVLK